LGIAGGLRRRMAVARDLDVRIEFGDSRSRRVYEKYDSCACLVVSATF
jgi:hypothetical protein